MKRNRYTKAGQERLRVEAGAGEITIGHTSAMVFVKIGESISGLDPDTADRVAESIKKHAQKLRGELAAGPTPAAASEPKTSLLCCPHCGNATLEVVAGLATCGACGWQPAGAPEPQDEPTPAEVGDRDEPLCANLVHGPECCES